MGWKGLINKPNEKKSFWNTRNSFCERQSTNKNSLDLLMLISLIKHKVIYDNWTEAVCAVFYRKKIYKPVGG